MLQTKIPSEEDLVFRLAKFFSDINCHEIFTRCKTVSYANGHLIMSYEHTLNPLNLIFADFSISEASILLNFTNIDYRINKIDPYFVSYSFLSEYSEIDEKFLNLKNFNSLTYENENTIEMAESEIIDIIKRFNKQIQCS